LKILTRGFTVLSLWQRKKKEKKGVRKKKEKKGVRSLFLKLLKNRVNPVSAFGEISPAPLGQGG
jgi:hypothetical protein